MEKFPFASCLRNQKPRQFEQIGPYVDCNFPLRCFLWYVFVVSWLRITLVQFEIGFSWLQMGSCCRSHMLLSYRNLTSSCLPPTCLHYQFSGKDLKQHIMMSLCRQRISEKQDRWLIYNLIVVNLIAKEEFRLILL